MPKFFNTSGPIQPHNHYHINPLTRVDWDEISRLIDDERYFVLHAPRQTGKTSALLAMMEEINQAGKYSALYVNIESAQTARGNVEAGIFEIIGAIAASAQIYLKDIRLKALLPTIKTERGGQGALTALLSEWAQINAKPIVLMLDEVDALVGDTLISLLRQIRAGYAQRPKAFPQSLVLCGVRDVRDYRIQTSGQEIITGGSAFNIKAESLTVGNFSQAESEALFKQHTEETGQTFAAEIYPLMWADTQGQPWLVNALGYELTRKTPKNRNQQTTTDDQRPTTNDHNPVTVEDYQSARERLIQSRATHLDQLADKLREPRVRTVMTALMVGVETDIGLLQDDLQYVEDLGLIRRRPHLTIANKIYQEIIPREITSPMQDGMVQEQSWYINPNHQLDMPKLLNAFQQFFRENAESWLKGLPYKEAVPQLLMQAFLQRIINGGGRINREYALGRKRTDLFIVGRKRTDLFIEWPVDEQKGYHGAVQRIVVELKIQHKSREQTLAEGLIQTAEYCKQVGAQEGYLIIFNRKPETPWEEKIWHKQESSGGMAIGIWGM